MKKLIISFTIVILVLEVFFLTVSNSKPQTIDVLVIHDKDSNDYLEAYQHLKNSLVTNITLDSMNADIIESVDLANYEVIYLASGLIGTKSFEAAKDSIVYFVKKGGYLFLENSFYNQFSKELIGAKSFDDLKGLPKDPTYPKLSEDEAGLQKVISNFLRDVSKYGSTTELEVNNYGKMIIPSTAQSLVSVGKKSLYTVNEYGDGKVFFSSAILPNDDFITTFDLKAKKEGQTSFDYTFATGSYLLRNEFLAYVAKDMYGYSVSKVLGPNGRPGMAIQNPIEEKHEFKNQAIKQRIDALKKFDEIPSISLAREAVESNVWKEGVTFLLNAGSDKEPVFKDKNASPYTAGQLLRSEKAPLSLEKLPEKKGLLESIELPYRAYIDVKDINKDEVVDIVSGSASGKLFLFEGVWSEENGYSVKGRKQIQLENNVAIDVGKDSAPYLFDMNGDKSLDLIVGMKSGGVVYFENKGDFSFKLPEVIVEPNGLFKNSAPAIGDIDADGANNLIVGTDSGHLYSLKGTVKDRQLTFGKKKTILKDIGKQSVSVGRFSAPKVLDYDSNGVVDILVGSNDGYIKRYSVSEHGLHDKGYLKTEKMNPFGNDRLWSGRNSVPAFADLNKDGKKDLLIGQLVYGFGVAIDSPNFAYKEQLLDSIVYAHQMGIEIQPHLLTQSKEQIKAQIPLHKQAFAHYGLSWNPIGSNLHSFKGMSMDEQPIISEMTNGIWWNSGDDFGTSKETGHSLWVVPFPLMDGKNLENFILFDHAPLIKNYKEIYSTYARFDLPFTHLYKKTMTEDSGDPLIEQAEFLDEFRNVYNYNFMTEEQMAKSFLAAYKADATLEYNPIEKVFYDAQNWIRRKQHHSVYITTTIDESVEPYTGSYQYAIGYKVEMGERYKGFVFNTDADVYMHDGTTLYFKGTDRTKLTLATKYEDKPHIMRANVPVNLEEKNGKVSIELMDDGMQQVKVYAPDGLELNAEESEGWKVKQEGNTYTLTRYGDKTTITIE